MSLDALGCQRVSPSSEHDADAAEYVWGWLSTRAAPVLLLFVPVIYMSPGLVLHSPQVDRNCSENAPYKSLCSSI